VITIVMSATIGSDRERVWRALTDPAELVAWDHSMLGGIDPPDDYPNVGQHVLWRYRLGSVQLVLHDRPRSVEAPERLHSTLSLGSLRFERTYRLRQEPGENGLTHLSVKLTASNSVPIFGGIVDRFDVRKTATEHVNNVLQSVQEWCENHP
jgi:uncharacterized protein YndB with AHSA1/START domain